MKSGLIVMAVMLGMLSGYSRGVEILEYQVEPCPEAVKIPHVGPDAEFWADQPATWTTESGNVSSQGWAAVTETSLRVHLEIRDPEHNNEHHGRNLWRGDCVYLHIDGRGDDSEQALTTNDLDYNDATYIFGRGTAGPELKRSSHGDPLKQQDPTEGFFRGFHRDEEAGLTIYDVEIPYAELNTAFGQSPSLGIALQIAHKNADGKDQALGKFRASKSGPREFLRLALPLPAGRFATIAPVRTAVLLPGDTIEATVALRSKGQVRIHCELGEVKLDLPVGGDDAMHHYRVRAAKQEVGPNADRLRIAVQAGETPMAKESYELSSPGIVYARLQERVEGLLGTAPNEIVRIHLRSTLLVNRLAFERLDWETTRYPERAEEFLRLTSLILEKLPTQQFDWDDHISRGLPLVFAFVSERDRSFQFYSLQMPYGYDPEQSYPLTIYLHGMGSDNPLNGLSLSFDCAHQDTLFTEEKIDPENIPPTHTGFVLAPWGRGNSMWRNEGESDFWQSLQQVRRRFKIDARRMYLSGFSMGCNGAWGVAARTPDLWAGVNLASGFGPWSQTTLEFLMENMPSLPIRCWIGELDRMLDGAKAFQTKAEARGLHSDLVVAPKLPHTYPYLAFQDNIGYLMQFTRGERPSDFTFVADSRFHEGVYGIKMQMPWIAEHSPLPRFSCRIEGQTVHITSENTPGLQVNLGEDGLGLSNEVEVVWNGEKAYTGPAETIKLGEGYKPLHWR